MPNELFMRVLKNDKEPPSGHKDDRAEQLPNKVRAY